MGVRKPLIFVGLALLLTGTLLFAFCTEYWVLLLSRILQRFVSGIVWTLGLANIADRFEEKDLG
jgi:predicted MFS family arabinose efflux permease